MREEEKILLWSSNLWYFGAGLLGPLFAVFTQRLGGDVLSISWVWGTYLISMGVFVILIGRFSDRGVSKRTLLLCGHTLNAAMTFSYLLVETPLQLMFVQLGLGLAVALSASPWSALYDFYSGDGKRDGYVWGMASGLEKMSTGIAILIGGMIVAKFSFDMLFITMGFVQILALLVLIRLPGKRPAVNYR